MPSDCPGSPFSKIALTAPFPPCIATIFPLISVFAGEVQVACFPINALAFSLVMPSTTIITWFSFFVLWLPLKLLILAFMLFFNSGGFIKITLRDSLQVLVLSGSSLG